MLWYRPIMDTEPAIPLTANRPRVPFCPPKAGSLPEDAATAHVATHPTTLLKNCSANNVKCSLCEFTHGCCKVAATAKINHMLVKQVTQELGLDHSCWKGCQVGEGVSQVQQ